MLRIRAHMLRKMKWIIVFNAKFNFKFILILFECNILSNFRWSNEFIKREKVLYFKWYIRSLAIVWLNFLRSSNLSLNFRCVFKLFWVTFFWGKFLETKKFFKHFKINIFFYIFDFAWLTQNYSLIHLKSFS